jgi:pyruvate ferredoxin oxidoreductase gamma subunit
MSKTVSLEIRFESIGGLGANLAGQLLAESLALRQNLNVSQFSSYGSEKKGTPVRSFIRVAEMSTPIRVSSPITEPDVLAVFHEALLARPATLAGLKPEGVLILNAPASNQIELPRCRVMFVDAMTIAVEEKTRINTAILGAVAKASPLIDAKILAEMLSEHFGRRSQKLGESNLKTFWRGHDESVEQMIEDGPEIPQAEGSTPAPRWGYLTAPMGGTILTAGNSVINNLSASRQGFAPRLDHTLCTDCGVCDIVCPDYCLVWEENKEANGDGATSEHAAQLLGIDYRFCKGCLRCVESCPSGALSKEREAAWVQDDQVDLWQEQMA